MKPLPILAAFLCPLGGFAQAAERPNIILLMGDDHGWEETGYNGHPHVKTPVLDEIAATGLRFDRFYAAHPSCSPTRASFLTGRHPNRMGTFAPGWSLRPEEITIAHLLGKAGYRCGHFGKWHVGPVKAGSPTNPGAMGFHEWVSHDNFFELNPSLSRNGGPPEVFPGESSEIVVNEAIRFIDGARRGRQALSRRRLVWLAARTVQRPARRSRAVRRLAREVLEAGPSHVQRNRRPGHSAARRSAARALRRNHRHGSGDRQVAEAPRGAGTSREHAAVLLRRQRHVGGRGARRSASRRQRPGLRRRHARPRPDRMASADSRSRAAPAFRACTSDLLPTLCALVGQPLAESSAGWHRSHARARGQDGRTPQSALFLGVRHRAHSRRSKPEPWIDPELQKGTTPLVKLMGGKATRDFINFRHPAITEDDYLGPPRDHRRPFQARHPRATERQRQTGTVRPPGRPRRKRPISSNNNPPPPRDCKPGFATGSNPSCTASPARITGNE